VVRGKATLHGERAESWVSHDSHRGGGVMAGVVDTCLLIAVAEADRRPDAGSQQ